MSDWDTGRLDGGRDRDETSPAPGPVDEPTGAPSAGWYDPLGVAAVIVGLIGIVVFGIALAIVTAILGAIAGQRAREAGRSLELPYLAFILAGVDGIVWLVLHFLFDISIQVG